MSEIEDFQDFVTTLESFKDLKSGISGSRIKKLTTYSLANVTEDGKLMNAIIEYAKTCPPTHKLGSLYIIDSIGRAYLDEKRARDEFIKPDAKEGTYAHALYMLGEAIQDLIIDAIDKSTEDNKEKIRTLIDIWDRAGLFRKDILNSVRAKCFSMNVYENNNPYSNNSNSNNISNNGSMTNTQVDSLPDNPRERCIQILDDLKPLSVVPNVEIPDNINTTDLSEQQIALFQLLTSIHIQYNVTVPHSVTPKEVSRPHITTEYGSRRDREKERERSVKRSRSRSPTSQQNKRKVSYGQEYSNSNNSSNNSSNINASNNHHLYPDELNVPSNQHYRQKTVSYDYSIPPDSVKVLSRTLFIGGVPPNMKEWDLANALQPFAAVQSVILNNARKHAFVKVYSRQEAENALMHFNKDGALPLRTRWGVGFGPRDCCDYQHGFSVIPLHKLTDADKKWSVAAQWGGTNNEPLVPGIVFEEPDISVGEGVSSKSMSHKVPSDNIRQHKQMAQHQQPMYGGGYQDQRFNYPQQQYNQHSMAPMPQQQQQQQQQQGFDPTAQLNSLMNMLNQQQSL